MAIKINGTTVIDDSRNLVNIVSGAGASTTVGDVTTYGLLVSAANYGTYNPGDTLAGSNLRWTNTSNQQSGTPSGTWQMCGYSAASDTPTVWQRIS